MAISSHTEVKGVDAIVLVETLREAYNSLGAAVAALPPGRRRLEALTHLETSSFYAIKAAAVGDE